MRTIVLPFCALILLPAAALGQTAEERIGRLEKALAEQREQYEQRIEALERRVEDLSGAPPRSELDDILSEMEAEADAALAAGEAGPATGATGQTSPNAFNPRITFFGDFVGRLDSRPVYAEAHHHDHEADHEEDAEQVDDRFALRSFEMDARADIDPFAKAVAVIAIHEHAPRDYAVEAEELYATFETLPFGLHGKLGKYRASFGTVNRLHPHDLPWTTAPGFLTEWFGPEGLNSTGFELSWLVPQESVSALEFTAGVTNGEEEIFAGGRSRNPGWLFRGQLFQDLSEASWVQVGGSLLYGRSDTDGDGTARVGGVDLGYRWRPRGERALETSLFAGAEGYVLDRDSEEGNTRSLGAYGMVQYQPIRDLYFGARLDYVEPRDEYDTDIESTVTVGLWGSWYTSEFLRFRLGWEHQEPDGGEDLDTLYFQFTFVFGSHPVEPYWFNR